MTDEARRMLTTCLELILQDEVGAQHLVKYRLLQVLEDAVRQHIQISFRVLNGSVRKHLQEYSCHGIVWTVVSSVEERGHPPIVKSTKSRSKAKAHPGFL